MAGSNQFKAIATGGGANVLAPSAYAALTTLLANGYQSGVANSAQINTTLRQSSFVATAIAQAIADMTGAAVNDDGVIANFENQFLAMLQQSPYQSGVAGGSADALTLTLTPQVTALVNGQSFLVRAASANATTTPTLSVNGLSATQIVKGNGVALAAGDIAGAGHWLEIQYDTTLAKFVLQNPANGIATVSQKAGEICFFPSSAAPSGFIKANGALVSRTTYAALYAFALASGNMAASDGAWVEGQFSPGDGSTTFRIPDMRGNFIRGFDDARGIDSGRAIGSLQADAMQGHVHYAYGNGGQGSVNSSMNLLSSGGTAYATSGPQTDGTNGTPRTAAETRPRNIALLACIKY